MALLDDFFARRVLQGEYTEEKARFLSELMHRSRLGDLCWPAPEAPSFSSRIVSDGTQATPVVKDQDRYYLHRNWVYETCLVKQLARLRNQAPPAFYREDIFRRELATAPLSPLQRKAVETALTSSLLLICGGPGTGKTYTAGVLVRLLVACSPRKLKVILAAPTGKAAAHLASTLTAPLEAQIEVMTLHRVLHLKPKENRLFAQRQIDADLVIVDEASMIDVSLLAHLFEAIGPATRLVLMGDPDQLPPVEASSLFAEMAALCAISLQGSMRTDKAHLNALAQGINQGTFPFDTLAPWPDNLAAHLYQAANPLLSWDEPDPQTCLRQLGQFRILGALRQGPRGTDQLNHEIVQEMGRRIETGQWWAIPIMITSNAPRLDLYNGTCGVLIGKSRGSLHLREGTAYFPEKVPYHSLPPFEVAFCLSIHKSQGSEFDKVLALFPQGSENFGRESLYTAVTRAKSEVQLIGDAETLRLMLDQKTGKTSGFTSRSGP